MKFEVFLECVRNTISTILGEEFSVQIHKVLKNNNIELDALTITESGSNISPSIYLNHYYEKMRRGMDLGDIINEIFDLYETHKIEMKFNVNDFKDFDKIKSRIAYKVINSKTNEKLLERVPYIPMLDLAIVFYFIMDDDFDGSATALIYHSHLDAWNIKLEELYEIATKNTPEILTYELKNMKDLIKEMLVEQGELDEDVIDKIYKEEESSRSMKMYVLTNFKKINGAACILYDGILEKFAEKHKSDLYILPSSIHEVILVPQYDNTNIKREDLDMMVKEVNVAEVDEGDVLSDHAYYYSRDLKKICM